MQTPSQRCINIKSKKFPKEQCSYKATNGKFCSRHYKKPVLFEIPIIAKNITAMAIRIQRAWKLRHGLSIARDRTPAFFIRSLCHNESELASFEPLNTIPRDYFFVIKDKTRFWGFDIRTLVVQYEDSGKLENPYTKEICDPHIVELFRNHLDNLKRWKRCLHYEEISGLSQKQSWNLRVLDMCLRLDMLGYRIATHWFTELTISDQKALYSQLFAIWTNESLNDQLRESIVPGFSKVDTALFKWSPNKISMKTDIDSVRRTNLNVMERLISSASQQSDKTLGAMYSVMALCNVSYRCNRAYPWLLEA
jgi:hypothetical protein